MLARVNLLGEKKKTKESNTFVLVHDGRPVGHYPYRPLMKIITGTQRYKDQMTWRDQRKLYGMEHLRQI